MQRLLLLASVLHSDEQLQRRGWDSAPPHHRLQSTQACEACESMRTKEGAAKVHLHGPIDRIGLERIGKGGRRGTQGKGIAARRCQIAREGTLSSRNVKGRLGLQAVGGDRQVALWYIFLDGQRK